MLPFLPTIRREIQVWHKSNRQDKVNYTGVVILNYYLENWNRVRRNIMVSKYAYRLYILQSELLGRYSRENDRVREKLTSPTIQDLVHLGEVGYHLLLVSLCDRERDKYREYTYIQISPGESIAYKELTAPAIQDLLHLGEVGNHLLLVLSLEK